MARLSDADQLKEIATQITQMVTVSSLFDYSMALHDLLDMPVKGRIVMPGRNPGDPIPAGLAAQVSAQIQQQLEAADSSGVGKIVSLMKEALSCAEAFLQNKPGFGPQDTAKKFAELADQLHEELRPFPQYEHRAERRDEDRAAAVTDKKGSKLTMDEHMALVKSDPLNLFSNLGVKLMEFQLFANPKQREVG